MGGKETLMEKDKKPVILGVIPARGGSKGIPRKNLKKICGKPLIYWSIRAAKQSKLLTEFIVSTEDAEIKAAARKFGAAVMDRPASLAKDRSTTLAVLQDIVTRRPDVDVIVLLQPTSPLRTGALIDTCIKKFFKSGADTLATGFQSFEYEWGSTQNTPRQELTGWFYDDGNVYVNKASVIRSGKWVGKKKFPMIVDKIFNPEIDDMVEFYIVEQLMKKYLKR